MNLFARGEGLRVTSCAAFVLLAVVALAPCAAWAEQQAPDLDASYIIAKNEGAIRYSKEDHDLQFCDGKGWRLLVSVEGQ